MFFNHAWHWIQFHLTSSVEKSFLTLPEVMLASSFSRPFSPASSGRRIKSEMRLCVKGTSRMRISSSGLWPRGRMKRPDIKGTFLLEI